MSGIINAVKGVFTSGFGIATVVGFIRKAMKAKAIVKEITEAYGSGNDVVVSLKNTRATIEDAIKDKKLTKEELEDVLMKCRATIKEAEEFYKEAKDVIDIFKD